MTGLGLMRLLLGQLTFHPSGVRKSISLAGVRWGTFSCVGWQVALCDPTWQPLTFTQLILWFVHECCSVMLQSTDFRAFVE